MKKTRFTSRFLQPVSAFNWGTRNRFHLRSDLHLARKAWHCGMGLFIVAVYLISGMSRSTGSALLGAAFSVFLLVEWFRLKSPALNHFIVKWWGPLMRKSEINQFSGTPFYLGAALLSVAIFPQSIACLAILYLAIGDPIASLVGITLGDRSVRFGNGKSLIGTLAGVLACGVTTWIFGPLFGIHNSHTLWILSVFGGLAGGAAELLPLEVDDNFSIPIVSGFVLWFANIFLHVL